jgi:tetratricopeptide (TPR) repeat protein
METHLQHFSVADFEREIGARLGRGDVAGAASAAAACRQKWPAASPGWLLGSIVALLQSDRGTALGLVEERLKAQPKDVQCLLQKAECLLAAGDRAGALAAAEAAVAASDGILVTLDAVAEFFKQAGEHERALVLYDRALARIPRDPTLLAKRAVVHRFLGNLDLAAADYEAILAIDPVVPKALKALTELRRQTPERNWIGPMERALELLPAGSEHAAIVHFGLAKSYEDLGEYATSWRHLSAANRLERALMEYDVAQDTALMDGMRATFNAVEPVLSDSTGQRPIFVIGLPRTGTTLVERILSNHPQVHSGGELSAMPDSINQLAARAADSPAPDARRYAERLAALNPGRIAQEYLVQTGAFRRDPLRLLDKQLTNILYCPLILRAFPNARLVHLTRHPLAACYAIFCNRFNGTYPFAYDLEEITRFYIAYRSLMAHWHRVLPGRILDVAYENVVTALESETRRILEYADLSFDPRCLEFHRNPAPVMTASSVQVRQPLYESSLHRWKHYDAELAPVRARLEAAGIAVD